MTKKEDGLKSLENLINSAQAVIERWDTPNWKDVPATAVFMNCLRRSLENFKSKKINDFAHLIVPIEPTEKMKQEGFKASERVAGCCNYHLNGICDYCGHGFDKPDGCGHQAVESYKAMINAFDGEK